MNDKRYGKVQVRVWSHLHPKPSGGTASAWHGAGVVRGHIVRVQVQRLPGVRQARPMWLWWTGPDPIDPERIFRAYLARFGIEHYHRFIKGNLRWTAPMIRTPAQAMRWSWVIAIVYTQLPLARSLLADHRLPWQKPLDPPQYTPGRVHQGFRHLQCALSTPARPRKTHRPGPGRPKGSRNKPTMQHPVIIKGRS